MANPKPIHFDIDIRRCSGEGHGSCLSCSSSGVWSFEWMTFLSYIVIDNKRIPGCFCSKCALHRASELGRLLNGD